MPPSQERVLFYTPFQIGERIAYLSLNAKRQMDWIMQSFTSLWKQFFNTNDVVVQHSIYIPHPYVTCLPEYTDYRKGLLLNSMNWKS